MFSATLIRVIKYYMETRHRKRENTVKKAKGKPVVGRKCKVGHRSIDAIRLKETWGSGKGEIGNDLVWRAAPQK